MIRSRRRPMERDTLEEMTNEQLEGVYFFCESPRGGAEFATREEMTRADEILKERRGKGLA